jgi:hypothetical protein
MKPTKITPALAVSMPRFEFIALWLLVHTRKKSERGPLGYQVQHVGGVYKVVSPIGGVVYQTPDADRLFDVARRGELGSLTRRADAFREEAFEDMYYRARAANVPSEGKSTAQIEREIAEALAKRPPKPKPAWRD